LWLSLVVAQISIPVGELHCRWHFDEANRAQRFEILHADPVINVSAEFLAKIKIHGEIARLLDREPWVTLEAGVLTFYPDNRDLIIYREIAYDGQRDLYTFCWPD
jgi:hypothetical protein